MNSRLAMFSLALVAAACVDSDRVLSPRPVSERSQQAASGTPLASPNGSSISGVAQRWIERGVQAGAALSKGYRGPPLRDHRTSDDGNDDGLLQRVIAAWNSHDAAAVVALYTADVVYEDVPFGVVNHGTEELRVFAQSFFDMVPDFRVELVGSAVSDEHGYFEWIISGTDVGIFRTGKTFRVRGTSVIDVRGDRISRTVDYYDLATLLRQVGLLPPGL
ncbi:MAG: hypothetical protein NVS1B4_12220 [Gemmatimonadaceae bacterium]